MIHETLNVSDSENSSATLTTYILQNYPKFSAERIRPIVLVIPGGGYSHYGQREQEAIAIKMNSLGFHAAILHYTLAPMRFPQALCDAANAVALIRKNAENWHVDSNKIILAGFSAGGHLSSLLGCFWNSQFLKDYISCTSEEIRPNFLCLSYPVVTADEKFCHAGSIQNIIGSIPEEEAAKICKSLGKNSMREVVSIEKNITEDFPPAFIWHTLKDEAVPAKNTILLANALYENGIDCEYHLFNRGKHALALASAETANPDGSNAESECTVWPELFKNWFEGIPNS
ncbi:MAG: alpha/beta hydrolase [Treponema sp.]|nr:alpha/beta hydrolase [Treponema sp.]